MNQPRAGYILIFLAFAALVSACATGTTAAPEAASDAPSRETRSDCKQILGTPFRSTEERTWFEANCSKWALTDVPNAGAIQLPPECAAMRGKPYTSPDQRQWFLANCNVGAGTPQPTGTVRASGTPTTSAFNTPGSAFNTPGENSGQPTGPSSTATGRSTQSNPTATPVPSQGTNSRNRGSSGLPQSSANDRTDCSAIGGTPYRSTNEQTWYLSNCFPPRSNQSGNSNSNSNSGNNSDRDNDDDDDDD